MCEVCDNIKFKEKIGITMVNKCFVIQEEIIDVFYEKNYILTIEKLSFHIVHIRIPASKYCRKT